MMFDKGEVIMHANSEVCLIEGVRTENFGKGKMNYYILKPVYDKRATIYCPVAKADQLIRPLLSRTEIDELIKCMPDAQPEWINDDRLRKERYGEIIRNGDHDGLMRMIKAIYLNGFEAKHGRRMHLADERAMKEAEKILYDEFGYVLGIEPTDVAAYISRTIEN